MFDRKLFSFSTVHVEALASVICPVARHSVRQATRRSSTIYATKPLLFRSGGVFVGFIRTFACTPPTPLPLLSLPPSLPISKIVRALRVLAGSVQVVVHPQLGIPSLSRGAVRAPPFAVLRCHGADPSVCGLFLLLRLKVMMRTQRLQKIQSGKTIVYQTPHQKRLHNSSYTVPLLHLS